MRCTRSWLVGLLGAMVLTGANTDTRAGDVRLAFDVTSPVTLHEPVLLRLTFENRLPDRIDIDLGKNAIGNLLMSITSPGGSMVGADLSIPTRPEDAFIMAKKVLHSGERYSQEILLNRWFSFDNVGLYRLAVQFRGVVRTAGGEVVCIPSAGSAVIEVRPRDEQRLRTTCEQWLDRLRRSQHADDANHAAQAISSINDPVVVEYLPSVIATEIMVADSAIDALQRLATPEAIRALEDATKDKRRTVVELAERALAAIRRKQ